MKVLLINNCHWPRGGSETVYFNTARLLKEYGHEVIFFSYEDKRNVITEGREYLIKGSEGIHKLKEYFCNMRAAHILDKVLSKEKPDIAHAHLLWGGMTSAIIPVLHKHGVPLVHTAHDYRLVCPAYLFKDGKGHQCERCKGGRYYECAIHCCSKGKMMESALMMMEMYYRSWKFNPLNLIDGFIFVSNFSRNKHVEFEPRFNETKTIVLYNFPSKHLEESYNKNVDSYDSYFLFYGRLSAEKGILTLIKAFERCPQMQLKVVGIGPQESELKRYVANHQMKNVTFLGYKNGKDLFDIVANAKYVCVSSECYENNPMTIVEAYSLGTPVIGASIGGITEVIFDAETGYKFESGNVDSLVGTLNKANNVDKKFYATLKHGAYDFAHNNFSSRKYLEKLIGFYKEVKGNVNF